MSILNRSKSSWIEELMASLLDSLSSAAEEYPEVAKML